VIETRHGIGAWVLDVMSGVKRVASQIQRLRSEGRRDAESSSG
jgi:hypothetical protein